MTITYPSAAQDLTCDEIHTGFDALIKRVAELAAERDAAFQMAAQATKDLVRARHQLVARDVVDKSRLAVIDGLNVENRRLADVNRELSLVNEDQQRRLDRDQQARQEPKPVRQSLLGLRIGNRL